jgi:DNA-binding response OmpR family regulator
MDPMDRVDREPASPTTAGKRRPGHGTVLIVGAEQSLRVVMRRMLARRGFDALEAADADEAVASLRSHGDAIAGVVLDLGMPARVAEETFACLRLARENVPVLFTGGYGEEIVAARLAGSADTDFLPKPFGLDALGAKADDLFANG